MLDLTLTISIIALIPVVYFVYDRFIRAPHKVNCEHGNIVFTRMISTTSHRDKKLVLVVCDLKVVNSGSSPITIKEVLLRYSDDKDEKDARVYSIPVGNIEGKDRIVLANTTDNLIITWENIASKISASNIIQPGGILRGSAVYILETPIDKAESIKCLSLVVRDYLDNETIHVTTPKDDWYQSLRRKFSLIDAPARKVDGKIEWENVEIT